MAYVQRVRVRFEDVDFARIVYYPRLFSYCHSVFEDFFGEEGGVSYSEVLQMKRVGFPTVSAKANFSSPLRFGDVCRVEMETLHLGRRSQTCRYRLYLEQSGQLCAELEITTVSVNMDDFTSVDLPEDLRALFLKHLASAQPRG
jgi:YbgC/YbaW family acyl-CoA thioester hydrolase